LGGKIKMLDTGGSIPNGYGRVNREPLNPEPRTVNLRTVNPKTGEIHEFAFT
jgi:hypothetical protein